MSDQSANLARVHASIGEIVLAFARERLATCPTFHMADLLQYVKQHANAAPASPDRILRQLRQTNRISYRALDRAESKYVIADVYPVPEPEPKAWDEAWSKPAAQKRMF